MSYSNQLNFYHEKTNQKIENANNYINLYEKFKLNHFDLPNKYKNIYEKLLSLNRKPTRCYLKNSDKKFVVERKTTTLDFN
jgi:hypothetical protein